MYTSSEKVYLNRSEVLNILIKEVDQVQPSADRDYLEPILRRITTTISYLPIHKPPGLLEQPALERREINVKFTEDIVLNGMKVKDQDPFGFSGLQRSIYTPVNILFKAGQTLFGTHKLADNKVYISDPDRQISPPIDRSVLPYMVSLELNYNDIKKFIQEGGKSKKQSKARKRKFNNLRKYSKKKEDLNYILN